MRYHFILLWGCATLVGLAALPVGGEDLNPPPITTDAEQELVHRLRENAALHDVEFVDADHGWAVGNHGAIWHTSDGGQQWQLQNSPTSADLHGVAFVDREHGWVVGGETRPYLWTSQAVVLRTVDGGKTWQQLLALIPALEKVQFFDTQRGVAWGRGSGGYPLGVFATEDGGRNWSPLAGGVERCWSGGTFADRNHGILVGYRHVAQIEFGDWLPVTAGADLPITGQLHAVQLEANGTAWLVGDNGQILQSRDRGATWVALHVLPADIAAKISWHAIAPVQDHVWTVGNPGSVVLHSDDGGKNWQGHSTGNRLPLSDVEFVDADHGWAVGALGTILHTRDGGRNWKPQRQTAAGVDLLMVLESADQLPLATLAKAALVDGQLVAVQILSHPSDRPDTAARLTEALSRLGCDTVAFGTPTVTPPHTAQANGEEFLAQLLRTWQPKVLIVPEDSSARMQLLNDAPTATQLAADKMALPDLQNQLALPAWQTKRIYALLPPDARGTHRVELDEVAYVGRSSLVDRVTRAQGLLASHYSSPRLVEELKLAVSLSGDPGIAGDNLLAGLADGSDSRTAVNQLVLDPRERQRQRRLAEKRRNLQNIFRTSGGNPALLAQISPLIADLDPAAGASLLLELADEFARSGQPDLQANTLELVARRYPNDPLVDHALVWLVQYYASGETAHAAHEGFAPEAQLAGGVPPEDSAAPSDDGVQPAAAEVPDNTSQLDRPTRAVQITQHIAHSRPLLYTEPQLRVPWARAELRRGEDQSPQKYLEALALRYPGDPWQARGEAERWLGDPASRLPQMPLVVCRSVEQRPNLDGRLDEPMWQSGWTALAKTDSDLSRTIKSDCKFACDGEFLYVALRCKKLATEDYTNENGTRTYDTDLAENDRVVIRLDVDRDYATYYELAVDYRGWTHDSCWGNAAWNPRWFVAAGGTATQWTIEAAIPWSELTDTPPTTDDAWAIAVSRHTGEGVVQSLTSAEQASGEFGLLDFR